MVTATAASSRMNSNGELTCNLSRLIANNVEMAPLAQNAGSFGNGDPNARLVRLEIEEMKEGIRIDGIDKVWWDCEFSVFLILKVISNW